MTDRLELVKRILRNWTPEWDVPGPLQTFGQWMKTTWVAKLLLWIYFHLFLKPFARLYLLGPYLWGYGFWNGLPAAEICTRLSGASGPGADHYAQYPALCYDMIERDIEAKLVFVETLIFIPLFLYIVVQCLLRRRN